MSSNHQPVCGRFLSRSLGRQMMNCFQSALIIQKHLRFFFFFFYLWEAVKRVGRRRKREKKTRDYITVTACLWLRILRGDKNNLWDLSLRMKGIIRSQKHLILSFPLSLSPSLSLFILHFIAPSLLFAPVHFPEYSGLSPNGWNAGIQVTHTHTHTHTHTIHPSTHTQYKEECTVHVNIHMSVQT